MYALYQSTLTQANLHSNQRTAARNRVIDSAKLRPLIWVNIIKQKYKYGQITADTDVVKSEALTLDCPGYGLECPLLIKWID